MLLTLLPGLQMLTRLAPEFDVDEQRTLAKAPSIEQPDRYLRQANTGVISNVLQNLLR